MGFFDLFKRTPKKVEAKKETSKVQASPPENNSFGVEITVSYAENKIIPVSERIKTAIASKHGLFPHEILVLGCAHNFYTSGNHFQDSWWSQNGIPDMQKVLDSLVERGFLEIGGIETALNIQKIPALKEVLKDHNLKQTGKKVDLVERVLKEIPEIELNKRFPQRTYSLTELGQEALKAEEYVLYIDRHTYEDLDIWTLNRLVYSKPYSPYRDKIWEYLNECSMKHAKENNWGLYRNCRLTMYKFLLEEKKYQEALCMLSEVVFYDLSGLDNNFDMKYLDIFAPSLFPYESSSAKIYPAITDMICYCQEEAGVSDDELKVIFTNNMSKLSVPFTLFTVEECIKIVFLERKGDSGTLVKLYDKAKKAFKQKYPKINLNSSNWG